MTYTVRAGDTLSAILKRYDVSSYASPSTWNLIQTRSGSPHLIRVGEQLNLSPVAHLRPGHQAPAPAPVQAQTVAPSQQLSQEAAKYIGTKDSFRKKFGTEEQLIPRAAILQFAEQQVNPRALQQKVRTMADADMRRAISGSGAQMSGYGMRERENILADLESQRRALVKQYEDQQLNRFTDWYAAEMASYEKANDPNWKWDTAGLSGVLGGSGYTPTKQAGSAVYNPLDLRDFFRGGISGYQAPPSLTDLYGTIT